MLLKFFFFVAIFTFVTEAERLICIELGDKSNSDLKTSHVVSGAKEATGLKGIKGKQYISEEEFDNLETKSQDSDWFSPFPGSKYKYRIVQLDVKSERPPFIAYINKCREIRGDLAHRGIRNITERREILGHVQEGIEKIWIGLRSSNETWMWNDHTVAEDEDIHWNEEFKNPDERHTCAFIWRRSGFAQEIHCYSRQPQAGLCEKLID